MKRILLAILIITAAATPRQYAREVNWQRYLSEHRKYETYTEKAAVYWQLPAELIEAVISWESSWSPDAVSSANCVGLMQINAGQKDPWRNIYGGTGILKNYIVKFQGDTLKALTAYNRGAGGARKYYRNNKKHSSYALKVWEVYQRIQLYKRSKNDNN